MYTLYLFADHSDVMISSSLPPELASLGHPIIHDPPFNLHATAEESSNISMPNSTLRHYSMDESSNISISSPQTATLSCTEQEVSSDSSAGQLNVEVPKPKQKRRKRCGKCENCLIPNCNICRYCL